MNLSCKIMMSVREGSIELVVENIYKSWISHRSVLFTMEDFNFKISTTEKHKKKNKKRLF